MSEDGYRFGFNGKENDRDFGNGAQDYGLRIHNRALGRFLSVDPLGASFPWNSSYAFAENRVIDGIDLEGGEFSKVGTYMSNVNGLGGRVKREVVNFSKDMGEIIMTPVRQINRFYNWYVPPRFSRNMDGVAIYQTEFSVAGGLLAGGGLSYSSGEARDKHGFTLFKLYSYDIDYMQQEEDGFDFWVGFDVDIGSGGYARELGHQDFYSSVSAQAPLEISVLPVDISIRRNYFEIGAGLSEGVGIQMFNIDEAYSISIGHGEKDTFLSFYDKPHSGKRTDKNSNAAFSIGSFSIGVGESGEEGTIFFGSEDTGIKVYRRIINQTQDDSKQVWETESYRNSRTQNNE